MRRSHTASDEPGRPQDEFKVQRVIWPKRQKGRAIGPSPYVRTRKSNYFFAGAITSLAALATRNFTTVLALILMAAPVWGLRPMRALRSAFTSRPMPGITNTPFFLVSLMAVSASRSRKAATCLLVSSSFSAMSRVRAVLVSPVAVCVLLLGVPLGSPVLPGFPSRGAYRMEGVRQHMHETLYSCGL